MVFSIVRLQRPRNDIAILMQPLQDTLNDRLQLATPTAARRAALAAVKDIAKVFCLALNLTLALTEAEPPSVPRTTP